MSSGCGKIVVIFATFNGQQTLDRVLSAYSRLEQPQAKWSLVAVDNASTDATPDILRKYIDQLPLTVLDNPAPGKNASLNMALRHIALDADLFIFTDDDAVPAPDFLVKWASIIREFPDVEIFGGSIDPIFDVAIPNHVKAFEDYFHILYASTSRHKFGPIPAHEVYGPNMAVRRSILATGATFREDIGPNNTQALYAMGSETEFCIRAANQYGAQAAHVDGPKVGHVVKDKHLVMSYIAQRAFRQGRGVFARMYADTPPVALPRPRWTGELRLAALKLLAPINARAYWRLHESKGERFWLRSQIEARAE